jgi:seryl-tRNA synthetase
MMDIKLIRENPELVRKNMERRQDDEKLKLLDKVIKLDNKWRELTGEVNDLRAKRNKISTEISKLKKEGKEKEAKAKMKEAAEIPKKLEKIETEKQKIWNELKTGLMKLPNMLHESVPYGKDDTENVVVKTWGKPPEFDFKPKNHLDITLDLDLIDIERAAKVSGAGFVYLKNELALLDLALQRFAIQQLMKKGFTLIEPPLMIRKEPYEGVTDLSDFETVMYKIKDEDLYLIATSEHPMGAMFIDEVIDKKDLPIKFCGVSACFRKEIGSHGKYTKGLFRMHQFNKIEQFIFSLPEQSWKFHEEIQKNSEELYQALGLHYRVVNVCTGDIGSIAAKKYDIEAWMADGQFREVGSNSNCTDYQARRLNTRFREKEGQAPIGFVHTLNNTALATSRTMIALLEQHQQKDGSVIIPKVLRPFMNGIERLEKK